MNPSTYLKKYLHRFLLCSSWLLSLSTIAVAQQNHMHNNPPVVKHVFLLMMDTMMNDMDKAQKNTDAESDFLSQMIAHHKGALKMAAYEIKQGESFEMRQLAKSILAEQASEQEQMRLWLKNGFPNTTAANESYRRLMDSAMSVMMRTMPTSIAHSATDKAFAVVMVPHHQAAIDMAKGILKFTNNSSIKAFAYQLISTEQMEIEQMNDFIKN